MDPKNMAKTKLTKKALMELERGLWIASNCWSGAGYPIYTTQVASLKSRDAQWINIRNAEANGRGFWIFRKKAELIQWIDDYRREASGIVDVEALIAQGPN